MSDELAMDAGNESTETATPQDGGNTLLTGNEDVQAKADGGDTAQQPEAGTEAGKEDAANEGDWTLDVPEGMSEAAVKELVDGCKKVGVGKDVAQKVLEQRQKEQQDWVQKQRDWRDELATDAEFGGTKYGETVALARKGLAALDPQGAVRNMLDSTGYGNNPEVIKAFARAGKLLGEDVVIGGKGGAAERPLADRLYND